MAGSSLFSLQPTFLQGFILGQISIFLLLTLILKYLFFERNDATSKNEPVELAPWPLNARPERKGHEEEQSEVDRENARLQEQGLESMEWFNLIVKQILHSYRLQLRDGLAGGVGDEIVRERVEKFVNDRRSVGFMDPIYVESVSLGTSAPHLTNAKIIPRAPERASSDAKLSPNSTNKALPSPPPSIEFNLSYSDSVSIRLTTCLFFNQPVPGFARLPVSLCLTLDSLTARVTIIPPDPTSESHPALTIQLHPEFDLQLKTTSLMGSRAKLANVPKVHELIEAKLKKAIVERGTLKIRIPGSNEAGQSS